MSGMKLYLVELQGMTSTFSSPEYGTAYVVADNPTQAYEIVKKQIDKWEVGYSNERNLKSVTLIADSEQYGESKYILHMG